MRLRWSIPLPGPFSVGDSVRLGRTRRSGGGSGRGVVGWLLLPIWWLLVAEAWLLWWCLKPFYILGVLAHRKVTGRRTPIWRSRNRWW